ncbi:MAG: helix-turn-helix domain-containing protein [Actinobacteria bacterium]|nr:helix-turn-helix domain-containing protein [Actinomycetota bacterium]
MAATQNPGKGGRRRRLTVPERYQVFLDVVSAQGSQRDVADKWRVDRSTVVHVCKVAKQGALDALATSRPGRPGKTAAELALEDALADNARLRDALAEQAVELHLVRGKERWG